MAERTPHARSFRLHHPIHHSIALIFSAIARPAASSRARATFSKASGIDEREERGPALPARDLSQAQHEQVRDSVCDLPHF